jgi:Domain of unknown function (DUF1707)
VSDQPDFRASDQQRDRAAAEIREHYAAGRLTDDELAERLDAIYHARTQGELAELKRDLPALTHRNELAERRRALRGELIQETGGAFVPFLICTAVWAFSGAESDNFWPVWLLLLPLIAIVRNGWRLYGPAPDLDALEEELASKRRREREERRGS